MNRYDPDHDPSPESWLALDEQERIMLVEQYHPRRRIQLPNRKLHVTVYVIVENQLAMPDHAIHAVGSVLAEQIYTTLQGEASNVERNEAYLAARDGHRGLEAVAGPRGGRGSPRSVSHTAPSGGT